MIFTEQSFRDFKTRYVFTIKYISTPSETYKLLLNIRIILSPDKIELLQKLIWKLPCRNIKVQPSKMKKH